MDFLNECEMLRQQINDQTWLGEFWGKEGAITKAKRLHDHSPGPKAHLALSSTYYAATGNAVSRWRVAKWQFWWLIRAWSCRRQGNFYSDWFAAQISVTDMTPGELTTLASQYIRACRYLKAETLIKEGLKRFKIDPDDTVLLRINYAQVLIGLGEARKAWGPLKKAWAVRLVLSPKTAVRLYRAMAELAYYQRDWFKAISCAKMSLEVADKHNLQDQLVKIRPLLKKLNKKKI